MSERVQLHQIPRDWCACRVAASCVYRVEGNCDTPRINKGNSDAACYRFSNAATLKNLTILTARERVLADTGRHNVKSW